jgi:presenilin 1
MPVDPPSQPEAHEAQTPAARRTDAQSQPDTELETNRDSKFYVSQLSKLLVPIFLTLFLSIAWIKLTRPPVYYYAAGFSTSTTSPSVGQSFGSAGGESDLGSLYISLIIISQIVVFTFIIAALFKYGKEVWVYRIVSVVVVLMLGYFGYKLSTDLLAAGNLALDWISLIIFIWNFLIVGLVAIFWRGPGILTQSYLVVMSSMMAYNLSQLPALVPWLLLSFLAVWDLVAVLCPYGIMILLRSITGYA